MPKIYSGWECHVWIGDDVPMEVAGRLFDLNCVLHLMTRGYRQRMFYRLLIHDEPGVERYLIRDADSRISIRERRCVDEWIASGKVLHTIHDHYYHIRPIQGGMFGIWRSQMQWEGDRSMEKRIGNWPNDNRWGRDEEFLEAEIWPLLRGSFFEHGRTRPIPVKKDDIDPEAFIGEIRDANDGFNPQHRAMPRR